MTRVMGIFSEIKLIGETITDQKIVEKVHQNLPKKYCIIVKVILVSKYFTVFSVEWLIGSLLGHDTRLNLAKDSMEQAFKHVSLLKEAK